MASDPDRDPVEQRAGETHDLYDIATWEKRTPLDAVAALIADGLALSVRLVAALVIALLVVVQVGITAFVTLQNPLLGLLTVLSAVPALVLAGYIWYIDPTLRESPRSLVVTFLLGIAFSLFAGVVNSVFAPLFGLVPGVGIALFFFLVVAPIEETVKWLAVRVYAFRRTEFDAVVDGAVYGAVAGLGFAFIENVIYITQVYFEAVEVGIDVVPAALGITGVRSLVGPGHVIFSAFAGYYLGLAKFNPADRGAIVVKGLLLAVLIHALYNTASTYVFEFVPFTVLNFVAFIVVFHGFWLSVLLRKLARYRAVYADAARDTATDTEDTPRE